MKASKEKKKTIAWCLELELEARAAAQVFGRAVGLAHVAGQGEGVVEQAEQQAAQGAEVEEGVAVAAQVQVVQAEEAARRQARVRRRQGLGHAREGKGSFLGLICELERFANLNDELGL